MFTADEQDAKRHLLALSWQHCTKSKQKRNQAIECTRPHTNKNVVFKLTPKIRQQKLTFKDGFQLSEKPNIHA